MVSRQWSVAQCVCVRRGWQSMAFVFYGGQRTRLGYQSSPSIGTIPFRSLQLRNSRDEQGLAGETNINLRKSAHIQTDSMTGRKAVWGEQFEGRWMFAAHVENAMKSRGSTVRSTGDDRVPIDKNIYMLHVRGLHGSRLGDRRDVRAWNEGVCGFAKRWGSGGDFFYFVTACNIF